MPYNIHHIGIISISQSGVDVIIEWSIDYFFTLSKKDGPRYFSPHFSIGGERWFLRIFPNGRSKRGSSGYVDLKLYKCDSDRSIRKEFSLSLKTVSGEKYIEKHDADVFEGIIHSRRCLRFISRSELLRRRYELMPNGVLTVLIIMKNTMSDGSAGNTAAAECCHCKGILDADNLSSHQKKCMRRHIKCPDCLEVIVLQKWLKEHECQKEGPEAGKGHKENSGNACVDASTQTEERVCAESLCEDYKKVLLCGRDHNLILKVGNKELRAHRDILRARSSVFESMLEEKNSRVINVPDCDPNAMELFLSYVYWGEIDALDHSNMLGLYYIAHKYEMMELKGECSHFIKESLSLTNICSVIQLALKHRDSDLLKYVTGYFADNALDIMQTVEWQYFLKGNSEIGNELLMKSMKKLKNA